MAFASVQKVGSRKVVKLVEVEVPAEQVTLTMTKREAAYVYTILGKVRNNKRERNGSYHHPVYDALIDVFAGTISPPSECVGFDYESLSDKAQDWVASQ
jgi:hypothetical protein